jgi:hypothetical protein
VDSLPRTPEEHRIWWTANTDVPYGYCWCGCGQETTVIRTYNRPKNELPGTPRRYLLGHHSRRANPVALQEHRQRWAKEAPDIPYGVCQCGCGNPTNISIWSNAQMGWLIGTPKRFINGHHSRPTSKWWIAEDRGFDSECWIWQMCSPDGYGRISYDKETMPAHRYTYEQKYGKLPERTQLHHRCRVTVCVNPDHLIPVAHAEHMTIHKSSFAATVALVCNLRDKGMSADEIVRHLRGG